SRFVEELRPARRAAGAAGRSGRSGSNGGRRNGPAPCRVCGKALVAALDRKLGRCADCPADFDEELYERLRSWRLERAQEQGLPAYCVFTDATLTAIAEIRPTTTGELATISGVGRAKLDRYGEDVLRLCRERTDT
ncbi:ATP-dependent DNA helicase, partial [Carbonactinospora thermoautotrophica]